VKCSQEQEFVVAGFTRSDARLPFASLILALQGDGGLCYAGHVGTGLSDAERARLRRLFEPLKRKTTPLAGVVPADVRRRATWLEPQHLVQVAFTEFTPGGMTRHPTYRGLREDKPAAEVRREEPVQVDEEVRPAGGRQSKTAVRDRKRRSSAL
jgi:bifunctional non-homologous end joining protein LigD